MKKLAAIGMTAAILLSCVPICYAAEDPVTTLTTALQNFETEVTVKTEDAEGTLQEVFSANPELFYYFDTYSATMSKNGKKSTYTFTYHDTDTSIDDIFVVTSAEELSEVVGYALTGVMETVPVVFTDSTLGEEDIITAVDDWRTENYLAYMGYEGVNATTYTSTEAAFSTWTAYTLNFLYIEDSATIQEWRQETEEVVLELCSSLFALDMPDWYKVLLIHDYIIDNCTYDEDAESSGTYTSANTAYGCLVEGTAVCEGYAETANLLFKAAGLNSYYVEGAGESADHAWNCVEIDGDYYWVDVTWDDPVPAEGEEEGVYHTYFNLTDSELNTDHSWVSSQYPSCTSTTWAYSAVQDALAAITDENGSITEVYENYSTENVTTLDTLLSDLEYYLGVDTSASTETETTDEEESETDEETDESAAASEEESEAAVEETEAVAAEATETEEKSGGGTLRTVIIVLIIVIILLVAYLIYRHIMYQRMLRRRRERERARRREEAARRRREQQEQGYEGSYYGSSSGSRSSSSRSSSSRSSSSRSSSSRSSSSRNSSGRSSSSRSSSSRSSRSSSSRSKRDEDRPRRENPFR